METILDEKLAAKQFAKKTNLEFNLYFTGGSCTAIYAETETHEIYITNNDAEVPAPNEITMLGIYLKLDADLVCEIWAEKRTELLKLLTTINAPTLSHLVKELINHKNNQLTKKDHN
jgi:hypothetical protein